MGGNLGPDQVGREQLGARQGQQGPDGGRGTGGKMVGWRHWGWGGGTGGGISYKGWVPDRSGGSSQGWGSRQGMGFQTCDGVPDRGCGTKHRWGSRHGMMIYQTDGGVPGRGGVTTFTSHQSEILHSLIFSFLEKGTQNVQEISLPYSPHNSFMNVKGMEGSANVTTGSTETYRLYGHSAPCREPLG